jgi:hypothetical protein
MFKVLDLRCGEFIHKADIYWNPEDAVYESRQAALQVISDMVRIRNDWNPYDDCKNLIPEYFEVIEV